MVLGVGRNENQIASGSSDISQGRKRSKKRRRSMPQRTCIGCRGVKPKRELVRVVRTPEGTVEVDPTGKAAGRGAYLCQQASCWEKALKRRNLDHALKISVDDAVRAKLFAYADAFSKMSHSSMDGEERI